MLGAHSRIRLYRPVVSVDPTAQGVLFRADHGLTGIISGQKSASRRLPIDLLQARFSTARTKRRRIPRLLRIADYPGIAEVCRARADPDAAQDDTHYLAGRPDAGL